MLKVRNQKAIHNLSVKSMRAKGLRNGAAILAIALMATRFTALFTIGGGLMKSMEMSTMRQVGNMAHAGYKYLTQTEYDAIKTHPSLRAVSYDIVLSHAQNPALHKLNVELRYSEDLSAQWRFCYPETGTMPQGYQEAAGSMAVRDALGVPPELGREVTLAYEVRGQTYQDTFTLCGFWQSDPLSEAEEVWLSKDYVLAHAPLHVESYRDRGDGDISGTINASLFFANSWDIAGKLDKVSMDSGFAPDQLLTGVNWAYSAAEIDSSTLLLVATVLLLILTAGYLIIYNVFYISVAQDIRYYGLLKTIGTTGRQLKTLVRRQALWLSLVGIPLGLVAGYGLGVLLMPTILRITILASYTTYSANPLIFIGASLFALATVWVSCNKPCRQAAAVSPMEALRYNETTGGQHISRASRRVSPQSMACTNVGRTKKKVLTVVLSLSLGIILMNTICTLTNSFDLDKYVENRVISDYNVASAALMHQFQQSNVEDDTLATIEAMPGVSWVEPVYMREEMIALTETAQAHVLAYIQTYEQQFDAEVVASLRASINEQRLGGHVYGASRQVLERTGLLENVDWDKFDSGDYILVIPPKDWGEGTESFYTPGSSVTLEDDSGRAKTYTVLAEADIPYAASCMHSHLVDLQFILPPSEYRACYAADEPMRVLFDVLPEQENAAAQAVSAYCAESGEDFVSKATYEAELDSTKRMIGVVGGALGLILGLIGVLNFVNAQVSAILARRRELAMLQSVGMTTRQLLKMLITEGLIYALLTASIVLSVGLARNFGLVQIASRLTFFITYHFTIWSVLLCVLLLLLIAWAVPCISFHNVSHQSVVERLRQAE